MSLGPAIIKQYGVHLGIRSHAATLTGDLTLTIEYPNVLKLDPGGASRNVTLPAESYVDGFFWILNVADAAENLVVKNAAGSTLATANQNESVLVGNIAGVWTLLALPAIAIS